MNDVSINKRVGRRYVDEDKNFWQKHINDFESSKLTRVSYCKMQGINRDRFGYWKKKLSARKATAVSEKKSLSKSGLPLLAVKISENSGEKPFGVLGLCSLDLGNGRVLQIHDHRVVEFILSRVS